MRIGRTFQDRSHVFELLPRPKTVQENGIIHNINVRGKRGNLGKVSHAVEYDFIPKRLHVYETDHVHFQWTGLYFFRMLIDRRLILGKYNSFGV